jgi:hypothetical protein
MPHKVIFNLGSGLQYRSRHFGEHKNILSMLGIKLLLLGFQAVA